MNWTQEEQEVQRAIAMLQGERINPEQNALPSDIYRPRPPDYGGSFLGYLQGRREEREFLDEPREERKHAE